MTHILFFCPSVTVINGGIKHIFRMAEALIELGYKASVFEPNGQRPDWFQSTAPIVGQGVFDPSLDQLYVLPEDQPHILRDFKDFPQKKVIYSQNHFYGALGIGDAQSYADYGVTDILCSSRTIVDHCRLRHPNLNSYVIPCAVDPHLFNPSPVKQNTICFMPRKRAVEAIYLKDMFRFTAPHYGDWQWQELSGLSEAAVAAAMGRARVFLSLSRLEGFGLTPLEAMASDCTVAGFTGIGGREYATDRNGFWVAEDDFRGCVQQLIKAVDLSFAEAAPRAAYRQACAETLAAYTPATFKAAIKEAWTKILCSA